MKEVYAYRFELIIATFINAVIILALSIILNITVETLFMMVPFVIIRSNAGGFHAKTHFRCISAFSITYLIAVYLLEALNSNFYYLFLAASFFITFMTIFHGIVPNANRPVTTKEFSLITKKCRKQTCLLILIGVALFITLPKYSIYFAMGMASMSMIFEKIRKGKECYYENHNKN